VHASLYVCNGQCLLIRITSLMILPDICFRLDGYLAVFFIWFSPQFQLVWNYPLQLDFRNWVHPQLLSDITRYVVGSQFVKTVTYLQRRRLRRTVMPNSAADRVNVGSLSRRRMSTTATFSATRYHLAVRYVRQRSHASWKVLEKHFVPGKSWKLKLKVLESPGKILKIAHFLLVLMENEQK